MNAETKTLEKHLKKTAIVANVISAGVAVFAALAVGYGFYYDTNSTLDKHTEQIKNISETVHIVKEDLNEIDVFKGVSKVEINTLENKVEEVETKIEKMDDKLDRILYQTSH